MELNDTQELDLGEGKKVSVLNNLGAQAHLSLKKATAKMMKMDAVQDGYKKDGSPNFLMTPTIDSEAMASLEDETMKAFISSFNGEQVNAYDRMMKALTGKEYEKVYATVQEISKTTAKK